MNVLIHLLRTSRTQESNYFYGHMVRKFTNSTRFDTAVAGALQEFDSDAGRRSSPYQTLTPNYLGNYRLRLERPGGDTRLFRFLLTNQQSGTTPGLTSDAQAESREFPISHLRVAYQMEAGFTIDDLCVTKRLREEYDTYQSAYRQRVENLETTGSYPIHIHKDPSKFNPDAIRAAVATNARVEEVETDWRAIRELLPIIREKYKDRFLHVLPAGSFNGNLTLNGNGTLEIGRLEAVVPGKTGIEVKVVDEPGHKKLVEDCRLVQKFY